MASTAATTSTSNTSTPTTSHSVVPSQSPLLLLSNMSNTNTKGVHSSCWDHKNAQEVWNTLDQRFTSTSRANILNLKLDMQCLQKGNKTVNGFLQKIKIAKDKLLAVGVVVDNEELLCIVLRGPPKEFALSWIT